MAAAKAFVARFVELSREGRACELLRELHETLVVLGDPRSFDVSPQEEMALRLKPDKAFKVATALMANKEAVAGLLNLLLQSANLQGERLVLMGIFVKLTSISTFAQESGVCSAAASFLRFQHPLLPKVHDYYSHTSELQPTVSLVGPAALYVRTVRQLVLNSPAFLQEARDIRLIDGILKFFPWQPMPFLSWAQKKDLTGVGMLATNQVELAAQFGCGVGKSWSFTLEDVPLLGDWIDRFLGFAVALEGPLAKIGVEGKGQELTSQALNFARVIMARDDVRGAFFTQKRLAALIKYAEDLTKLGGNRGAIAAELVHDFEQIRARIGNDKVPESSINKALDGTRVSLSDAERFLSDLRRGESKAATCRALNGLLGEVRKPGWEEEHTRKLAAGGCFPLLLETLEKERFRKNRKGGAEPGTCEGPVWPVINVMQHLIVTSFRNPDEYGNKAFLGELGAVAPRLLGFLEWGVNVLPEVELASLMETVLVSFDMNIEAKWANLWRIVDVMLTSQRRYIPGQAVPMLVWDWFFDYRSYLPEPSEEAREFMTSLRAGAFPGPEEKNWTWKKVLIIAKRDEAEGIVAWSEEAKQRKIATACVDVLSCGHERIGAQNSPVANAAAILRFCCRFPSVVKDEVRPEVGILTRCLKSAYPGMCAPYRESARAQRALLSDVAASATWHGFERTVSQLSHCMLAVLALEPLDGALLDEIARNGGADFAAEVMKTRKLAEQFVARNDREEYWAPIWGFERGPGDFEEIWAVADTLWEALAKKYALKRCSYEECTRDMVESRKNTFRKCAACKKVQYCSKDCQVLHWKEAHKSACKSTGKG